MFKSRRLIVLFVCLVLIVALGLIAFTVRSPDAKTSKIVSDWSRGIRIGESPWNQSPALVASDDGKRVHLAWTGAGAAGAGVFYLQMDASAQRVAAQWIGPLAGTPQSVQIILDQQNRPHVFVIGQMPGESIYRLAHAGLNEDGTPRLSLQPVSPAAVPVRGYTVVPELDGALLILWAADPESSARGLYVTRLDADSRALASTQRLTDSPTIDVAAVRDRKSNLHVIWGESSAGPTKDQWRRVKYAQYANGVLQPTTGIFIEEMDAPPRLALDDSRVYVLWGREVRGGAEVGLGYTRYTSFPLGNPNAGALVNLRIPLDGAPPYLPYTGAYNLKALASTARKSVALTTDLLHSPAPANGQRSEIAVATVAALSFGVRQYVLPTLVILREGQAIGYQVIAYNSMYNRQPVLAVDRAGNLYVAWITGSSESGFGVYYAATTDGARAQLDGIDLTDIVYNAILLIWASIGGLALLPLFLLVLIPPAVILVSYTVFGHGVGALDSRASYALLFVIGLAYWLTKEIFFGFVLADPFFAQGLTGTAHVAAAWLTQIAIAAVAIWVTYRQIASKRIESVFGATLVFVACDMVLTMLIAGSTLAIGR